MNYTVNISGIVHSVDPIRNPGAYARATFGDNVSDIAFTTDGDKRLLFDVEVPQKVLNTTPVQDIIDGLLTGDDRNVDWKLELKSI